MVPLLKKTLEQVRVLAPSYVPVAASCDGLQPENRSKMATYLAVREVFEGDNDPLSLAYLCREGVAELTRGGVVISPDGQKALETAAFEIVLALAVAEVDPLGVK